MPTFVVEEDRVLRQAQIALDPSTSAERIAAYTDFNAHDLADYPGWLAALRARLPGTWPATVRLVTSEEELAAALPEADAVIVESMEIGPAQLALAPRLRAVFNFGLVADNVDADACKLRGIPLLTLRRRTNISMAEHTMLLVLALARRLPMIDGLVTTERMAAAGFAHRPYDNRHTAGANFGRIPDLRTAHGRTLGLLGFGEIGREVAAMARAFGMQVLYHKRTRLDPAQEQELHVQYCGFDELFERAEFLSVHVPSSPKTKSLVDAAALGRMRPGSYLINTSRADVVNHDALVEALHSGHLAGAGLDVHYGEPAPASDPLLAFGPKVILTPHMGGGSRMNILQDIEEMLLGIHAALQAPAPSGRLS